MRKTALDDQTKSSRANRTGLTGENKMPIPWGAVATLGTGLFSAAGARRRNQQQIQMAREQMQFQERMSSTAHQRAAKDLEAAGLNRILGISKGASTPGGAQAAIQDEITPAISSAMQAKRLGQELKNMKAEEKLRNIQYDQTISNIGLQAAQKAKTLYEANSAQTMSKILKRDEEIAGIDEKLYEKVPFLRILEKILGTGASAKTIIRD
jgi:hypothetical protein